MSNTQHTTQAVAVRIYRGTGENEPTLTETPTAAQLDELRAELIRDGWTPNGYALLGFLFSREVSAGAYEFISVEPLSDSAFELCDAINTDVCAARWDDLKEANDNA